MASGETEPQYRQRRDEEQEQKRRAAAGVEAYREAAGRIMGHSVDQCSTACDSPVPSGEVTLENIERLMNYQPWNWHQRQQGEPVREALLAAARAILRNVPAGTSRTAAIEAIRAARMLANQGITFGGGF